MVAVVYFIARVMILGTTEKQELAESARIVDRWGKVIISCIGMIMVLFMNQSGAIKWFWILFIMVAFSFQLFIDFRYRKDSKQFVATLIALMVGLLFIVFLL